MDIKIRNVSIDDYDGIIELWNSAEQSKFFVLFLDIRISECYNV